LARGFRRSFCATLCVAPSECGAAPRLSINPLDGPEHQPKPITSSTRRKTDGTRDLKFRSARDGTGSLEAIVIAEHQSSLSPMLDAKVDWQPAQRSARISRCSSRMDGTCEAARGYNVLAQSKDSHLWVRSNRLTRVGHTAIAIGTSACLPQHLAASDHVRHPANSLRFCRLPVCGPCAYLC
jgi:hypothetical protein